MKRKRLIFLFLACAVLTLCLVAMLVGTATYRQWTTRGLPDDWQKWVREEAARNGVMAEVGNIRLAGFDSLELTGIKIHDATLRTTDDQLWPLLGAERVLLTFEHNSLLARKPQLAHVAIHGAQVNMPLSLDASAAPLILDVSMLSLQFTGRRCRVVSLRGEFEGVAIETSGDIQLPIQKREHGGEPLTVRTIVRNMPDGLRQGIRQFQEFCRSNSHASSAALSGKFLLPLDQLRNSRISLTGSFSHFLFRGLNIESLTFGGSLAHDNVAIQDFNLTMDNQEHLRGDLNLVPTTMTVSGQLSYYGFPRKLLKAMLPEWQPQYQLPELTGAPLLLTMTLHPSPARAPADWHCDGSIRGSGVQVLDAQIEYMQSQVTYRDRTLHFTDLNGRVKPNIDVRADGAWHIPSGRIFTEFNLDGTPHFISQFSRHPRFRQIYAQVWRSFVWPDSQRPHFAGSLYYDPAVSKKALQMQFHSSMSNFRYRGVPIDQFTTSAVFDLADKRLLLSDLEAWRNGKTLSGDLAILFGQDPEIKFNGRSRLAPEAFVQLVHLPWDDWISKYGFRADEHTVHCTGAVYPNRPDATRVHAMLEAPQVEIQDLSADQVHVTMDYKQKLITGRVYADAIVRGNWTFDHVTAKFRPEDGRQHIEGHVDGFQTPQVMLNGADYEAIVENGDVGITATGDGLSFMGWSFANLKGSARWNGGDVQLQVTAEQGSDGKLESKGITTRLQFEEEQIRFNTQAAELSLPDVFTVTEARVSGDYQKSLLSLHGTASSVRHNSSHAYSEHVTFLGTAQNDELKFQFATDQCSFTENCDVRKLQINVEGRKRDFQYVARADTATLYKKYALSAPRVEGRWNSRDFELEAKKLELPVCQVTNFAARCRYASQQLSLSQIHGTLYGGNLKGSLYYDFADKRGMTWWLLMDADFATVVDALNPTAEDEGDQEQGRLACELDLTLNNLGPNADVSGLGKIHVTDGAFYNVPILSEFLTAVSKVRVIGIFSPIKNINISEIKADLEFEEQKIHVANMKSNGDLVAVSGDGYYWWGTPWVDFRFRAEPLRDLWRAIPLIGDPLKVLLERRVSGSPDDLKWVELSRIRDLFRSKKKSEPPPGPTKPPTPDTRPETESKEE